MDRLDVQNQPHASDGCDLLWVSLYTMLRHDEAEEHASQDPENAFLKVESDLEFSEFLEDDCKVGDQIPHSH